MANRNIGLIKKQVEIPAYGLYTMQFDDTAPNFYRVQNSGNAAIYCSPDNIPTQTKYDFMVPATSMRVYTEPHARRTLFMLNPSGSAITVSVTAFYSDFDPLTLALGNLEVTIPGSIQASSVIDSFNCSLPVGSNVIGKVGLDTTDAGKLSAIKDAFDALMVDSAGVTTVNLRNLYDKLSYIQNALNAEANTESLDSTSTAVDYNAPNGYKVDKIVFCSNDGNADKVLTWYEHGDGTAHTLTIKPGEVVNELPVNARSVEYAVGGGRIVFTVREA